MGLIFVTRHIPEDGITLLKDAGHIVEVSEKDGVLTHAELIERLHEKPYDAVLCLLNDRIDAEVFRAVPTAKIFANYAVGYDNINVKDAHDAGVTVTNTPGVLTDTVAEYTIALMLSVAKRIPEADVFTRSGKYTGWAPEFLLGVDLKGKKLGILGAGRIGLEVAKRAHHGLGMSIMYYDTTKNALFEHECDAVYADTIDTVFNEADVVSVHVPLTTETTHLVDARRLALMKPSAILINTSRGPVVDEKALASALMSHAIRGAGIDVFEFEPRIVEELTTLPQIVMTPHIASASEETRSAMSRIAAQNIIDFLVGKNPQNCVNVPL
ncbi:MAG TPA: D-glycerate dehydrogenase [Candidatus Paceibacterota bacterium]|nr:D-glycerate dehydrogenase [Candidatus Paceibacterota bacterium]